jgi:hypothetical protein
MATRTTVEILNSSLQKIAEVRALAPINKAGMVLRYSQELSDYGTCEFRIGAEDPIFTEFGDIVKPHAYHVRLKRGGTTIWQGAIIDNPSRTGDFIHVKAAEYDFYLDKVLVKRTRKTGFGESEPTADIGLHYRVFSTGTMASAVQTVITEAQAALGSSHILSSISVGTIENPNYPAGFVDSTGHTLTGGWTFTDDVVLQFDYHSVLYVLKAFGVYSGSDFQVNPDLSFDFKDFIGNKNLGKVFEYGTRKNILNYDVPRYGGRMANDLYGIGSDTRGVILHNSKQDIDSINTYGLLQSAGAYSDVKDKNSLNSRLQEELRLISQPEESPINIMLDGTAYDQVANEIGSIVTVRIQQGIIDYNKPRRIVGITVTVHNTGREVITLQTNRPKDDDLGA